MNADPLPSLVLGALFGSQDQYAVLFGSRFEDNMQP